MKTRQQSGFTLVELAIVLVVIGLILGMAFKGKDLIDSAKVKNMAAQYNKVVAGANTFYEKYGYYPGDGCPAAGSTIAQCNTAVTNGTTSRNGVIDSANEQSAFWNQLVNQTNILTAADQRSIFGQNWNISLNNIGIAGNGNSATGNQGNNFLFIGAAPATASCSARSRSTSWPCCWGARRRCCPLTRAMCCMRGRKRSGICAPRRRLAR